MPATRPVPSLHSAARDPGGAGAEAAHDGNRGQQLGPALLPYSHHRYRTDGAVQIVVFLCCNSSQNKLNRSRQD